MTIEILWSMISIVYTINRRGGMEIDMNYVFFCGPHCSGKTTIIRKLYLEKYLSEVGYEIGKDLFYKRNLVTAEQDKQFEVEISTLEVERDFSYATQNGIVGIESWHPGNLAYAMVRNPSVVSDLIGIMKSSPLISKAVGIRFHITYDMIYKRTVTFNQDREWAARFYSKIEDCLDECLVSLDLMSRCVSINANRPFNTVYNDVKKILTGEFRF